MTDSSGSAAKSKDQGGENDQGSSKFSVEEELLSRSALSFTQAPIGTVAVQMGAPDYTYVRPPSSPYFPVQSVVDRRPESEGMKALKEVELPFTISTPTGEVLEVLFSPVFGKYGQTLPSDPGQFSLSTSFGAAICPTLAPYAAARCERW